MRWAATLLVPLLLFAGACLGGGCPCGSDPSDPLSAHDPSYSGAHVLQDECVCRCGADEPFAVPRDRACADYDGPCVDELGDPQALECE